MLILEDKCILATHIYIFLIKNSEPATVHLQFPSNNFHSQTLVFKSSFCEFRKESYFNVMFISGIEMFFC